MKKSAILFVFIFSIISILTVCVSASVELPKMPAATDLRWNVDGNGNTMNGSVAFKVATDEAEFNCKVKLYCDDGENPVSEMNRYYNEVWDDFDNLSVYSFVEMEAFSKSGKYVFSVTVLGDGENYSDSEEVFSSAYNLTLPEAKLDTPQNVRWVEPGVVEHTGVLNAGGYSYKIFDQNEEIVGSLFDCSADLNTSTDAVRTDIGFYIDEIKTWTEPGTVFYVRVKALTGNVELYRNSEFSALSDGFLPTDAVAGDVNGDGTVDRKDLTRLAQYFARWDVEIDADAADANGDGKVDRKDLTRLAQYFARWDVELGK